MARPKDTHFYDIPLPETLQERAKWLVEYHKYSKMLISYLIDQGAGSTTYHTAIRCLTELRTYLLDRGIPYSSENAEKWLEFGGPYPKGYQVTLFRMSDFFNYGEIRPINAFPRAAPYADNLHPPWSDILTGYMSTLTISVKYKGQVRNCVARFLYKIQKEGISTPSEITYELLEEYCRKDEHCSKNSEARYTYAIGDILLFMADRGYCDHGLGWYPYFRMHKRIFLINDLTEKQKKRLVEIRRESLDFPAERFSDIAERFLDTFQEIGYSETPCKTAKYTVHNLLLFIEMHGFGYHKAVADIWLEHEKCFHKKDGWKQARRVLNLLDLYVREGRLLPQRIFWDKPPLCESLPDWCQSEIEGYLLLKEKEGWEKSTLYMIRSSATRFCSFLVDKGLISFSQIVPEILKEFNLNDKHQTVQGKNAYNGKVRQFIRYLERNGVLPYGIHQALLGSAAPGERITVVLTKAEKETIKSKHLKSITPTELRDRAMVLLGLRMGLRASDIVEIQLTDIDWEKQTLRVIQEKTDHEILLPIPTIVGNVIYLYIVNGRPNDKTSSNNLFVKNRVPYDPVKRGVCANALKRTVPERRIPGSGFHVTRKTYATDRLRNGTGKQGIADLLGQKDTQSLRHYLQLDEERMRMCPISLIESGLCMEGGRYHVNI